MYELLDAFKEVILNIGSSHDRSTKAALCVAEGLLIVSWTKHVRDSKLLTSYTGRLHHQ